MGKPSIVGTVRDGASLLAKARPRLVEALPPNVPVDRFISVVATNLQMSPKLLECTRDSFFLAAMRCAQLGLEPLFGQAYILPYNNRRKGVKEAQFMLGYQGMIELHLRSGLYRHIEAQVVYEGEHFKYQRGLNPILEHVPNAPKGVEDLIAAYTIAWPMEGGNPAFDVMWRSEIDLVRKKARSDDTWGDPQSFPEMAKKTVVRRHSKYLKKTPEIAHAVALDDVISHGTQDEIDIAMGVIAEDLDEPLTEGVTPEVIERQEKLRKQLEQVKLKFCPHESADMVDGRLVCTDCGEEIPEADGLTEGGS